MDGPCLCNYSNVSVSLRLCGRSISWPAASTCWFRLSTIDHLMFWSDAFDWTDSTFYQTLVEGCFFSFILRVLKPKRANEKLPWSNPAACKNLFQWEVVWTYNASSTDFYHLRSKAESNHSCGLAWCCRWYVLLTGYSTVVHLVQQTNHLSSGVIRQIKKELKPQTSINNFTHVTKSAASA